MDGQWGTGVPYGDDFEALWFPGQNGCISLVAGLYFWGMSRQAMGSMGGSGWDGVNRMKWERAVQDVVWMLEGLEAALPEAKGKKKTCKRT